MTNNWVIYHRQDSSISKQFRRIAEILNDDVFVLVTCLDSSTNVKDLRHGFKTAKVIGDAILVPLKTIKEEVKVFYGFDEIWFTRNANPHPKPASISIVSPTKIDEDDEELMHWMDSSEIFCGMGDGVGANIIMNNKYRKECTKQSKSAN